MDEIAKLDPARVLLNHEGRIGNLEKGALDLEARVHNLDSKFDRLMTLGWRILAGLGVAIVVQVLATVAAHIRW